MPIGHALLTSIFLILVAVSAALVASMVVLALFDLAFGKEKPSKAAEIESGQEQHANHWYATVCTALDKGNTQGNDSTITMQETIDALRGDADA